MSDSSAPDYIELVSEGWPSIPEYYAGRSLFVTGGSGFMGKVLIEKLLRSCPDLRTIYLLLRPKKGKSLEERIRQLGADPLFERLLEEQPAALSKLHVICGDVKDLGLGLNEEDRQLLLREVSVVFHSAASVRFDDSLKDAVLINVRGTREMLRLAQQMPLLQGFLHLSTTFCNCNQTEILEKIYPAPGSWEKMISFVENTEDETLIHSLTPKVLGSLPNTYTYAKALAEQLVNDHKDTLPLIIIRPSIVTPTASEPVVGWTDNLNGPMGIWMGCYTGVLRVVYVDKHQKLDFVPVDSAIKSMIFFAWHRAVIQPRMMETLPIYNCNAMVQSISHLELLHYSQDELSKYPTAKCIWYPVGEWGLTQNYFYYFISVLLCHMLPAILIDVVLRLTGRKSMFVKLYRRIFIATDALSFFTTRDFHFKNNEFVEAERFMLSCDKDEFSYSKVLNLDKTIFAKAFILTRELILKDPPSTFRAARKHHRRLYFLDRGLKGAFLFAVTWVLVSSNMAHAALAAVSRIAQELFKG